MTTWELWIILLNYTEIPSCTLLDLRSNILRRKQRCFLVPNFNIIDSWIWSVRDVTVELANPQIGPQGTPLDNTKCVFRSMESSIRAHASILYRPGTPRIVMIARQFWVSAEKRHHRQHFFLKTTQCFFSFNFLRLTSMRPGCYSAPDLTQYW